MYQPPRTARERAIIRVKQPRLVGKISKLIRSASARSSFISNRLQTYQDHFKTTLERTMYRYGQISKMKDIMIPQIRRYRKSQRYRRKTGTQIRRRKRKFYK